MAKKQAVKKELTRKQLTDAAVDMNNVLALYPPMGHPNPDELPELESLVYEGMTEEESWEVRSKAIAQALKEANPKKMDAEALEAAIRANMGDVVFPARDGSNEGDPLKPETFEALRALMLKEEDGAPEEQTEPEPEPEEQSTDNDNEKEEGTMSTQKKAPAKAEKKAPAKAEKKAPAKAEKKGKDRGPGVIATIVQLILKEGPITKKQIVERLATEFPDRDPNKMSKTVNVQVPNRINKERGLRITLTENGYVNKRK